MIQGTGKKLFHQETVQPTFELTGTNILGSGSAILTYRPATNG